MLQLTYKHNYLSITEFDPVTLPALTVITGKNGSGKSHLLNAIEQKAVSIGLGESPQIAKFNFGSFSLIDEQNQTTADINRDKYSAWELVNSLRAHLLQLRERTLANKYEALKEQCNRSDTSLWRIQDPQYQDVLQRYKNEITQFIAKGMPARLGPMAGQAAERNVNRTAILLVAKKLPYAMDEVTKADFYDLYVPYSDKNDFLPQALGRPVWEYHVKQDQNRYNKYQNDQFGTNHPVLTEEEFQEKFGPKPWEVLNNILSQFENVNYRFTSPEGLDRDTPFVLKLVDIENPQLEVKFSMLSSGERILLALAASVFKASADQDFPDLLLLDELDATLHPSMIRCMLDVVQNVFLKQGMHVILVTHSPSTVALAPEDSIYVVNKTGKNRIQKRSKQEALHVLTEGFATLDEGITLFDSLIKSDVSLISEGANSKYFIKACELYGREDINVITGLEDFSGKSQLITLFKFFSKLPHKNKIIFVLDCDAAKDCVHLEDKNNTYIHALKHNAENQVAAKGIENIFPAELLTDFSFEIKRPQREEIERRFDGDRKRDFENFILARSDKADFNNFAELFDRISAIHPKGS